MMTTVWLALLRRHWHSVLDGVLVLVCVGALWQIAWLRTRNDTYEDRVVALQRDLATAQQHVDSLTQARTATLAHGDSVTAQVRTLPDRGREHSERLDQVIVGIEASVITIVHPVLQRPVPMVPLDSVRVLIAATDSLQAFADTAVVTAQVMALAYDSLRTIDTALLAAKDTQLTLMTNLAMTHASEVRHLRRQVVWEKAKGLLAGVAVGAAVMFVVGGQ